MTIAAAQSKVIYAGDGVTTAFPFAFEIETTDGSDLQISVVDNLGNVTLLTSNYSVDVANAKVNYPTVGGVAPLGLGVNAVPANWNLVINRVEPLSQTVSLSDQNFSLPALEEGLDKIVMTLQQLQEQLNRAVLLPINTVQAAQPVVAPTVAPAGLVQLSGTWNQLVTYAALNPTVQFLGYVNSGDLSGSWFFYSGNVLLGNQGFLAAAGG